MLDIDTRVLQQTAQWQRDGVAAWLLTVARTWGASQRPPGALMALRARGKVAGSVSGGCVEDDLAGPDSITIAPSRPTRACHL